MNPSAVSAEQQGDPTWVADNWVDHPASVQAFETRQYPTSRTLDWDWENAMLLSQQPSEGANDDEQDRKLTAGMMGHNLRTTQNGINIPTALPAANFSQHSVSMLNSAGFRNFASMAEGSSSFPSSSFHGSSIGSSLPLSEGHGDLRASAIDQRRHLFSILRIQDPKTQLSDIVKREAEFCAGDSAGGARIGLNLGVRTYFSTDDTIVGRTVKRPRANCPGTQAPLCQAEGCKADLSVAKHYHRRHKVCDLHSKAPNVIANGQSQRFCQQCSRFHLLSEFDDGKRSCRKRLADHNRRRRKPQPTTTSAGVTAAESLDVVKKEDNDQPGGSRAGSQVSTVSAPDAQALLSTISRCPPVTLMNVKRELPVLPGSTHEAVYQYLHGVGQTGTHLSLSTLGADVLGLEPQTRQNATQNYNALEPPPSWLRTGGVSRSDMTDNSIIRGPNLQHLMLNKGNQTSHGTAESASVVQVFVPSIQNLMPVQSSRDISSSDWVMRREQPEQFRVSMPGSLEGQQVRLSLLEAPRSVRTAPADTTVQRSAMDFLQHEPTLSSNDGDDSQSGSVHRSHMKFPDLQSLRPFVSAVYSSNLNMP